MNYSKIPIHMVPGRDSRPELSAEVLELQCSIQGAFGSETSPPVFAPLVREFVVSSECVASSVPKKRATHGLHRFLNRARLVESARMKYQMLQAFSLSGYVY